MKPVKPAPVVEKKKEVAKAPAPPPPAPVEEPKEEPKPVVLVRATETPPVAPQPEPEPEEIEQPAAPAERNTFYAFTDHEISKLKKRNKKFGKLVTQHKKCASKNEKLIMRREQLREEIIELQNLEDRTPSEDRKLKALRSEEHRMKNDRASLASCDSLEKKLTEMLQAEYGTTAAIY